VNRRTRPEHLLVNRAAMIKAMPLKTAMNVPAAKFEMPGFVLVCMRLHG